MLTTDEPGRGTGIAGRTVTFTLGTGCLGPDVLGHDRPDGHGRLHHRLGQPVARADPGHRHASPATGTTGSASAASTVNLPEGTQLTVTPTAGTYNGSTPVSGTLINTYTNQPVPNEPVTLTVNGTQSCTATTNANGVATCSVTPNEPAGTYSLDGIVPGGHDASAAAAADAARRARSP